MPSVRCTQRNLRKHHQKRGPVEMMGAGGEAVKVTYDRRRGLKVFFGGKWTILIWIYSTLLSLSLTEGEKFDNKIGFLRFLSDFLSLFSAKFPSFSLLIIIIFSKIEKMISLQENLSSGNSIARAHVTYQTAKKVHTHRPNNLCWTRTYIMADREFHHCRTPSIAHHSKPS